MIDFAIIKKYQNPTNKAGQQQEGKNQQF